MVIKSPLSVKKLPEKTTINGYAYELVQRDDHRAIYAQHMDTGRIQYEVFRIKISYPRTKLAALYAKRGKTTDHLPNVAESFPGDEDFGDSAWSCFDLQEAQRRFELIKPGKGGVGK